MDQKNLTRKLIEASRKYYAGEDSGMSDLEFDRAVEKLRQMEQESGIVYPGSPAHAVGAEAVTELKKARHEAPALSLDKVKYKDRENLIKWMQKADQVFAAISWKCDGLTVVLTYDNGSLTSAVTRGEWRRRQRYHP